jgi:hypothetical protein
VATRGAVALHTAGLNASTSARASVARGKLTSTAAFDALTAADRASKQQQPFGVPLFFGVLLPGALACWPQQGDRESPEEFWGEAI